MKFLLDKAIAQSEVVILAFPVDKMVGLLPSILDKVDQQIVVDLVLPNRN
jgi:prephenate dehydrogenase